MCPSEPGVIQAINDEPRPCDPGPLALAVENEALISLALEDNLTGACPWSSTRAGAAVTAMRRSLRVRRAEQRMCVDARLGTQGREPRQARSADQRHRGRANACLDRD